MPIKFRNAWGSADSNLDQQRQDLFRVSINLPPALGANSAWNQKVEFAVSKFPFPARSREVVPIKYLNMTNFQIGADTPTDAIEMTVRYAFNQETATVLEKWHWMTSHPGSGGVALTSLIKANGTFWWLVPSLNGNTDPGGVSSPTSDGLTLGGAYQLEGIILKGLKPSDGDMETSNGLVNLSVSLQIDRYYPIKPEDLKIQTSGFNIEAGIASVSLPSS